MASVCISRACSLATSSADASTPVESRKTKRTHSTPRECNSVCSKARGCRTRPAPVVDHAHEQEHRCQQRAAWCIGAYVWCTAVILGSPDSCVGVSERAVIMGTLINGARRWRWARGSARCDHDHQTARNSVASTRCPPHTPHLHISPTAGEPPHLLSWRQAAQCPGSAARCRLRKACA